MQEDYFYYISKFYVKLLNNINRDNINLIYDSVLLTLFSIHAKDSKKYLKNSSFGSSSIPSDILNVLEKLEYVIKFEDYVSGGQKYTITSLGIWEVEKNNKNLSEKDLLLFIQRHKNFTIESSKKNIADKNKLTLFSLICLRCFSSNTSMDLNNETLRNEWTKVFELTFVFLNSNNYFSKNYNSLDLIFNNRKIDYFMSHVNSLQILTNQIYSNLGNKKYYLDLYKNDEIDLERLKFVLLKVLDNIPDIDTLKEISEFCIKTANNMAPYVIDNYCFINAHYDDIIKRALKEIYFIQA